MGDTEEVVEELEEITEDEGMIGVLEVTITATVLEILTEEVTEEENITVRHNSVSYVKWPLHTFSFLATADRDLPDSCGQHTSSGRGSITGKSGDIQHFKQVSLYITRRRQTSLCAAKLCK